jgi:type I restriction enzyme, S subunit
MTEIAPRWAMAPLRMLGTWTGGGTPSKRVAAFWTGDIAWVSPKDMKVFRIKDTEDHVTAEAIEQSAAALVPRGSVLVVTRSGILRHTLPVAVADIEVALNQDLKALTVSGEFVPEYVAWALRRFEGVILSTCAKSGTTVQNIETAKLLDFEVPLAPSAEQHRIVTAIEEHFSRLDAADRSLDQAKRRLATLRAATLTEFVGEYEAVEFSSLVTELRYGTSIKCSYEAEGRPVLRIPNVQGGNVDLSDLKFATDANVDLSSFVLEAGDLLFVRTNGSRDLIGRVASVNGAEGMAFASYLIRARPDRPRLDPRFAVIALSSPASRGVIEAKAATTAGQYNLNLAALRSLPVPLPPIEEQRLIVAEVERRFSIIDAMAAEIERARRRSHRLRRAILERAFSGKLVPQDPSDEPTSVLLERIASERATVSKPSRRRRKVSA